MKCCINAFLNKCIILLRKYANAYVCKIRTDKFYKCSDFILTSIVKHVLDDIVRTASGKVHANVIDWM